MRDYTYSNYIILSVCALRTKIQFVSSGVLCRSLLDVEGGVGRLSVLGSAGAGFLALNEYGRMTLLVWGYVRGMVDLPPSRREMEWELSV